MRLFKINKTNILKLFVFLFFGNVFVIAYGADYETFVEGIFSYTRDTSSESNFVRVSINRENRDTVTEVTIPETVTYKGVEYVVNEISEWGFSYCSYLHSVTVPASIDNIGDGAFSSCIRLKNFIVDAENPKYSSLSDGILYNKDQTIIISYPSASGDVRIREGVVGLKSYSFYNSHIKCLTLPSTIKYIEDFAYCYCNSLSKVIILAIAPPTGIEFAIYEEFGGIPIPTYVPAVVFDLYKSVDKYKTKEEMYPYYGELPEGPKEGADPLMTKGIKIGDLYYLLDSENMTAQVTYHILRPENASYITGNLEIPEKVSYNGEEYTVTSIGEYAFILCDKIISVSIPETVTEINQGAFYNCTDIISVNVADVESLCKLTFTDLYSNPYYYAKIKIVGGEELVDLVIPESITEIPPFTFIDFNSIRSVVIGENIEKIGEGAFAGCDNLEEVEFNATECLECGSIRTEPVFPPSLKKLTFGENVKRIPSYSFKGCSGLTTLEIGKNIEYIGGDAFSGCDGITKLFYNAENCKVVGFSSLPSNIIEATIGNDVVEIGKQTFSGLYKLTEIEIPENVRSVGTEAFYGCFNLKSVTFGTKGNGANESDNLLSKEPTIKMTSEEPMQLGQRVFDKCNAIRTVVCMLDVAPVSQYEDVFEKEVYNESELFLPLGKYSEYKRILPWKLFKYYNTHQVDFSGDSGVAENLAEEPCGFKVYSIDGRLIMNAQSSEALDVLQNGLYIINGKKVLINR